MATTQLKHRYHDSSLEGYRIGPRRELTLDLRLDGVWNPGGPKVVRMRFSAIANLDEVRAFFERQSGSQLPERVDRIELLDKGKWTLELERAGTLTIATGKPPREQDMAGISRRAGP